MTRVTCRCGERLTVQPDGPERIACPKCGAKIRLRHAATAPAVETAPDSGDGFLRFLCPCGRRLKVPAADRPVAGRCPDCGRVVPVPTPARPKAPSAAPSKRVSQCDPEARTEELDADDLVRLETWGAQYTANSVGSAGPLSTSTDIHAVATGADPLVGFGVPGMPPASEVKFEAGLRVCPRCKKPVHLGAAICRECGTPVPR
jgi:predicted  nucleic acid-binding Zn-ribbon protein